MTPYAFVLPEGEYHTALDVTEEILQSLNNADPPAEIEITVDDDWNVTLNSQREGLMITLSTGMGWMTENNTLIPGVRLNASLTSERNYGHDWFILPAETSITYPGIYTFRPSLSLCSCKQRLVHVKTNLLKPWQVGDRRLPLLHEIVPLGSFRETLLEEREHIVYLPLRTKIFQTIRNLFNGWIR